MYTAFNFNYQVIRGELRFGRNRVEFIAFNFFIEENIRSSFSDAFSINPYIPL